MAQEFEGQQDKLGQLSRGFCEWTASFGFTGMAKEFYDNTFEKGFAPDQQDDRAAIFEKLLPMSEDGYILYQGNKINIVRHLQRDNHKLMVTTKYSYGPFGFYFELRKRTDKIGRFLLKSNNPTFKSMGLVDALAMFNLSREELCVWGSEDNISWILDDELNISKENKTIQKENNIIKDKIKIRDINLDNFAIDDKLLIKVSMSRFFYHTLDSYISNVEDRNDLRNNIVKQKLFFLTPEMPFDKKMEIVIGFTKSVSTMSKQDYNNVSERNKIDIWSSSRKVVISDDTHIGMEARQLHPSHKKYLCPVDSPHDAHAGLYAQLSCLTIVAPPLTVPEQTRLETSLNAMLTSGGKNKVFYNGFMVGTTNETSHNILLSLRKMNRLVSVYRLDDANANRGIHVATYGGRLLRWVMKDDNFNNGCFMCPNMPVDRETTNANFFLGFAASLVPLLHHNAGPRGVFMANMMKQTLDPPPKTAEEIQNVGATKRWNKHNNNFISTLTTRALGRDNYGMNMLVKWACHYGYNIEDGIVVNSRLLLDDNGIIQNKFVLDLDKNDILAASDVKWKSNIYNYDSDGIIREGTTVVDGTLLASKIHITSEGLIIRKPLTAVLDRPSIVQSVIKTEQRIIIITSYKYKLTIGDKLVSSAAQKGVITHAVPPSEKADLIINPCCIPSRMTMGQIWEGVISNYMHEEKIVETWFFPPFNNVVITFTNMIKEIKGLDSAPCLDDLIPKSGFWYAYNKYFVLSQRVDEKYRVRGASTKNNINPFTNQPQKGRKIKGGLRIGVMERDVLLSYNAKNTMKQLMSRQSDEIQCYLCPKCECYGHLEICSLCNIQATKVTIDKSIVNLTNALKNIPYL